MNMTQHNTRLAFAGLFSLFLGLGAPLALAQTPADPAPAAQPAVGAQQFSDELQQTEDADKARELQQQANEQMLGVIEENDISVDEYNAINQAVQTDPELRNRVLAMLK
jgi:Domain of unknown function (DUF4168)